MSFLSKEKELITFIETKKIKKKEIEIKKILCYFSKIIKESIIRPYTRLNDILWAQECSGIVFNIFWQLFSYSNNIKLSMFMCERAILLFNEYIDLAKSTFTDNTSEFKINSTDVKIFIYKRTIGPTKLRKIKSKKFQSKILNLKDCSIYIKHIFNKLSISIVNLLYIENKQFNIENDINKYLEYSEKLLPFILFKIYNNNLTFNFDTFIQNINLLKSTKNIIIELNKLRIHLEIFYYIYKQTSYNQENIYNIYNKLNLKLNNIKYNEELNKFFSNNLQLKTIKYYNNLKNQTNKILLKFKK